jgi:hypothetical protein
MTSVFGTLKAPLSVDFSDRTTNYHCSKLFRELVKPDFRSKRRGRSVRSICLLDDNACPHTIAVTTGSLEENHWEILPHPTKRSDLVSSDFHLFDSLIEALGGKRFRTDQEIKLLCNNGWTSNHEVFLKWRYPSNGDGAYRWREHM